MKEIKKIEQIAKIVFQAYDGTEFTNKEECITYEQSAKCAVKKAFIDIPHYNDEVFGKLFNCNGDEVEYLVVFPRDANDIKIINQLYSLEWNGDDNVLGYLLSNKSIGTGVICGFNYDGEFFLYQSSLDSLVSSYQEMLALKGGPLHG